ncbi:MAG TPA: diguanylate cyclase [bacterium]|nr:diguanylate cyclase [bacterium]
MTIRPNRHHRRGLYHATLWGSLATGALLVGVGLRADPRPALPLFALFLGLALLTESGHLTLPYAGYVSFGAIVALPAVIIVGPGYAALFGALGQLVSNLRGRRPVSTVLFNPGQKALCIAASGAVWNLIETGRPSLAAVHPMLHPVLVLPAALASVAVYTLATHIVVSLFSAARRGLPVGSVVIGNAPMRVAAATALGSFGLLVALVVLGIPTDPPNVQYVLILAVLGGLALLDWDFHRQTSRVQRAAFERGLERAIGRRTTVSVVNVSFETAPNRSGARLQDEALREVARLLTLEYHAHVDVVSRRGATELVALLPQTGRTQATMLADRICRAVEGVAPVPEAVDPEHPPGPRLAVCLGMASFPEDGGTIEALIRAADRSMRALSPTAGRAATSAS